ncbi:NADAR family protein [Chitinophaga pendula]|uniref:NADAR family protein n=1 Tax=Chitinophaga TaxID=79328 RepID=UPI000BAEBF52|nr:MULTISPECIES: NADAR family protein [Chitinophaga]ASZ12664.1 hypothetical protein CK934_17725 [Chitinophaga sp. MD30]UCJ09725.1 NADAR family protein [Chitinophaga pendula]
MYNIAWLREKVGTTTALDYQYFWGHIPASADKVDQSGLSQWYESPFIVNGRTYPTAEHWMMAHKALLFNDRDAYGKIMAAATPGEAKAIGREVKNFSAEIWEENAYELVIAGNIHKFNQHPSLSDFLLNTGDSVLVEASPTDTIWGIGLAKDNPDSANVSKWKGSNLLGFALMEARDFLRDFGGFEALNIPADLEMPWDAHPDIPPMDIFWRMGAGESIIDRIAAFYSQLDSRQQVIFQLTHPPLGEWLDFYADEEEHIV